MTIRDRLEALANKATARVWGAGLSYTSVANSVYALTETPEGYPLLGVFDSNHELIRLMEGLEVIDRAPVLDIELDALGFNPKPRDKFTLTSGKHSGETYTVTEVRFNSAKAAVCICVAGDLTG